MTDLALVSASPLAAASTPTWLDRTLYPFDARWFATDEGRLHYVDEGPRDDPAPLVLVHGTPTWSFEHRAVITALRADRRVIALDHLGFGLSDKPERGALAPADHARRLGAFLDVVVPGRFTLFAHDFGVPIGLGAALERIGRLAGLVVSNGWMWATEDDPKIVRISRVVRGPIGRLLYLSLNASPRWLLPSALGDRRALSPEVHRHYVAPFAHRRARRGPWVLGCELAGSSSFYASIWARRAELASVPSAIVWGARDPALGARELARMCEGLPHATVARLPHVGHFPAEEAPGSVVEAIRAVAADRRRLGAAPGALV